MFASRRAKSLQKDDGVRADHGVFVSVKDRKNGDVMLVFDDLVADEKPPRSRWRQGSFITHECLSRRRFDGSALSDRQLCGIGRVIATRLRAMRVVRRQRLASGRAPRTPEGRPRLYDDFASWWPILSDPADYASEAARHRKALVAACARRPRTLLELGSGGGNNVFHMKRHFRTVTLVDRSEAMLAVSRRLNPDCEHVRGDMRSVRLGRTFDAVFVHDAIGYMTTEKDLAAAIATAYAHTAPGGAALFVPDYVRETFKPATQHGGHDGRRRGLRYLMWTWDPDPRDTSYLLDFAYLLRHPDGMVTSEYDRHTIGLFAKSTWKRLLADAGFRVKVLLDPEPDLEPHARVVFVGRRV